ncbi:hypothetical protein HYH03_011011 [Edaphochlamys debaryana]|uniref:PUA domain-containing protein n=1 Tax=Edaphochlamys debaryana TaxID=47281 RepID=A0A835XVM1_9CHLO|nr:hypothetical protein HYH03_011011 [Edaphochlamys debaryana]|eukprot:KAG2490619.1 hypothetical protein HYH03_011011 [Edaphochlamys debaryana]
MSRPRGYVKEVLGTDASIFVIKVGTSSLVRPEHQTVNLSSLARLCEAVRDLRCEGHHVIIVTSGAVGVGCQHLGLPAPDPSRRRALAAVGQVQLIRYYEDFLAALGLTCAQVLLTLDNLAVRQQYLSARHTFAELLSFGVVPVVNENDTVAAQEARFGDNDTLAAQVAALVGADWLYLLTDVDCLYTANPKDDPTAVPIHEVEDISRLAADTTSRGTAWGTGGMATKLTAGRIATAAGCTMVICSAAVPENIVRIAKGEPNIGTKFHPLPCCLKGRKRWILSVPVRGQLWLSPAAVRSVRDRGRLLVAAGVERAEGDFAAQECVSLLDPAGREFARGLVNLSATDLAALLAWAAEHDLGALITGDNSPGAVLSPMGLSPPGGSTDLAAVGAAVAAPSAGHVAAPSAGHVAAPSAGHVAAPSAGHVAAPSAGHVAAPPSAFATAAAGAVASQVLLPRRSSSGGVRCVALGSHGGVTAGLALRLATSAAVAAGEEEAGDDCALGYDLAFEVVVHRSNLVLLAASEEGPEPLGACTPAEGLEGGEGAEEGACGRSEGESLPEQAAAEALMGMEVGA